jgi:hypothetical protein
MRRCVVWSLLLAGALAVPVAIGAHAGHVHKVMGTVTVRQDNRVELKTQDGKSVTVVLNAKTTFLRGKQKVDASAVKIGDRMVVEVVGEKDMTAKAVTLSAAPAVAAR